MLFKKEADNLYSKLEEQEVNGETQYFKKHRVFPIFNKDGSFNWRNFIIGKKSSWIVIGIIVIISIGIIFEYISNLKVGAECIARENLLKNLTLP